MARSSSVCPRQWHSVRRDRGRERHHDRPIDTTRRAAVAHHPTPVYRAPSAACRDGARPPRQEGLPIHVDRRGDRNQVEPRSQWAFQLAVSCDQGPNFLDPVVSHHSADRFASTDAHIMRPARNNSEDHQVVNGDGSDPHVEWARSRRSTCYPPLDDWPACMSRVNARISASPTQAIQSCVSGAGAWTERRAIPTVIPREGGTARRYTTFDPAPMVGPRSPPVACHRAIRRGVVVPRRPLPRSIPQYCGIVEV